MQDGGQKRADSVGRTTRDIADQKKADNEDRMRTDIVDQKKVDNEDQKKTDNEDPAQPIWGRLLVEDQ